MSAQTQPGSRLRLSVRPGTPLSWVCEALFPALR